MSKGRASPNGTTRVDQIHTHLKSFTWISLCVVSTTVAVRRQYLSLFTYQRFETYLLIAMPCYLCFRSYLRIHNTFLPNEWTIHPQITEERKLPFSARTESLTYAPRHEKSLYIWTKCYELASNIQLGPILGKESRLDMALE